MLNFFFLKKNWFLIFEGKIKSVLIKFYLEFLGYHKMSNNFEGLKEGNFDLGIVILKSIQDKLDQISIDFF